MEIDQSDLQMIYKWADSVPLSKPKRNINRDFSNCCLVAELIAYEIPKLINLHNYPQSNSYNTKVTNWKFLRSSIIRKLLI